MLINHQEVTCLQSCAHTRILLPSFIDTTQQENWIFKNISGYKRTLFDCHYYAGTSLNSNRRIDVETAAFFFAPPPANWTHRLEVYTYMLRHYQELQSWTWSRCRIFSIHFSKDDLNYDFFLHMLTEYCRTRIECHK